MCFPKFVCLLKMKVQHHKQHWSYTKKYLLYRSKDTIEIIFSRFAFKRRNTYYFTLFVDEECTKTWQNSSTIRNGLNCKLGFPNRLQAIVWIVWLGSCVWLMYKSRVIFWAEFLVVKVWQVTTVCLVTNGLTIYSRFLESYGASRC